MATTLSTHTEKAIAFFYEHAGYNYDPTTETPEQGRRRVAEYLAMAERHAFLNDWYYEWSQDFDCIGCMCGSDDCACFTGEPHETWLCCLYNADHELLDSLGSICSPSHEYRRVVEAEMAADKAFIAAYRESQA